MPLLSSSLRESDLVNSRNALSEWMEELIALDGLPLSQVQARPWGYILTLRGLARCRDWLAERSLTQHFLLGSTELDRFRNYLLITRPPKPCAALCSWLDLECAAQELRERVAEPKGWTTLETYSNIIIGALQISEGSLNSSPPVCCTTHWGKWLRVDPPNTEQVLNYLLLDEPAAGDAPRLVSLGAGVFAVLAANNTELRIGICNHLSDDLALKDAVRWLKQKAPHKANKQTGAGYFHPPSP